MSAVTRTRGALASRQVTTGGQDWRHRAACRGEDPEVFHSNKTWTGRPPTAGEQRRVAAAKAICARCPVTDDCLAWAQEIGDDWAVLGGMTATERREARRQSWRECQLCQRPFWSAGARYCSAACRDQAGLAMRTGATALRSPDLRRVLQSGALSDAQLAAAAGVSTRTVARLRAELETEGTSE